MKRIIEDFRNCTEQEMFYCEKCEYQNKIVKNVQDHFLNKHKESDRFSCWDCEGKCKTIHEFKTHIGNNHFTPSED